MTYFNQSQLLLAKTYEHRTANRKALYNTVYQAKMAWGIFLIIQSCKSTKLIKIRYLYPNNIDPALRLNLLRQYLYAGVNIKDVLDTIVLWYSKGPHDDERLQCLEQLYVAVFFTVWQRMNVLPFMFWMAKRFLNVFLAPEHVSMCLNVLLLRWRGLQENVSICSKTMCQTFDEFSGLILFK